MHFNDGLHQPHQYSEVDANLTAFFKRRHLDFESEDPYLARGDPSLEISLFVLDAAGSELGFFAAAILGCVFILLNQVDGKIFRLKIFLMNREFNLAQNENFIKFVNFILNVLSWLSLLMPFIAIAVWASGLIIRAKDFNSVPIGGICVLLVSMSLFFFMFGVLKIKWNNFQFKIVNGVCILLAFSLFTAYQFVAIFLDKSSNSYFGFSSVFLNANCCVIILTIFLNSAIKGGSIEDLLVNKMVDGEPRDETRTDDFLEEVQEEIANKSYFPTKADVLDLFTLAEGLAKDDLGSAFGGGLQSRFGNMNNKGKRTLTFILWSFATAILIVYSYVIHWYMDRSRLGFVTMITVLLTDVFVYLIWNSQIAKSPTVLCFSALLNRLLLYVFGGNYWIYGYMVMFVVYGVILSWVITSKRFPFESAYANMNIDKVNQKNTNQVDVSRSPEFLLLFITTCSVILFVVLYVTEPRGVPLLRLDIDEWEYPYYINGVFCLLLVATFFALLGTFRLFIRKKRKIEPKIFYFIKSRRYDMYWIYITASFILCGAVGLIAYWITDILSYFLVIIFVSIFVIMYLNAFLHYVMNDYEILQDITQFNLKIDKHNERIGLLKEKVNNIKKDLLEGKATGIGEASVGLAKNIIEQDRLRKKDERQKRKLENLKELSQTQKSQSNLFGMSGSMAVSRLTLTKNQGSSNYGSQVKGSSIMQSPSGFNSKGKGETQAQVNLKVQPITINKVKPVTIAEQQNTTMNIGTLTPNKNPMDEDDKLINEEIMRNSQQNNNKDDDIYEGGEDEIEGNGVNENYRHDNHDKELEGSEDSDRDSTDDEFDLEQEDDEADQKRSKKRLKNIKDWRQEYNPLQAFFQGKLRHNDYQIILSIIIAHASLAIMAILVSVDTESVLGVNIAIPLVHYTMAGFSLAKLLNTDATMTFWQYFFFFASYCIQYGWAIANLFISYTREDIDPELPGAADAGSYMVVYLMVIPFITSSASAAAKWIDDKGHFTYFLLFQLILTGLQGLGMLILAYVYMTYIQGIIVTVVVVALGYIIFQIYVYVKNDFYMPTLWTVINLVFVLGIIISATVVSLFFEEFRTFTGVSISIWVTAALFIVYALAEISTDLANMEKKPVFFSPWIFPIYIYNPKKNDVEPHNFPSIALIAGLILMMIWSVLCSVWVYPHNVGISLSIFFELLLIITCFHLIGVSAHQLRDCTLEIDNKLIRRAWLDAKLGYINNRNAVNRE